MAGELTSQELRDQAWSFAKAGRIADMVECLKRAVDLAPGDAQLYNDLGVAYHALGDRFRAQINFLRAIEIDPQHEEARANLAELETSGSPSAPAAPSPVPATSVKRPRITALVHTYNAEATLADCLRSLSGNVDELIIVDTRSNDRTIEIARQFTTQIRFHDAVGNLAAARAASADWAGNEWLLYVPADAGVPAELWDVMGAFLQENPTTVAVRLPQIRHFLGRPLRHDPVTPSESPLLLRKGAFRWRSDLPDELETTGPLVELPTSSPDLAVRQNGYRTLDDYLHDLNRVTAAISGSLPDPRAFTWQAMIDAFVAELSRSYDTNEARREGTDALIWAMSRAVARLMAWAKLYERAAQQGAASAGASGPASAAEILRYALAATARLNLGSAPDAPTDEGVSSIPGNGSELYPEALRCLESQEYEQAEKLLRQAVARDPLTPQFHSDLGVALFYQGDVPQAQVSFLTALAIDPHFTEARANLDMIEHLRKQTELRLETGEKEQRPIVLVAPDGCGLTNDVGEEIAGVQRPLLRLSPESVREVPDAALWVYCNLTPDELATAGGTRLGTQPGLVYQAMLPIPSAAALSGMTVLAGSEIIAAELEARGVVPSAIIPPGSRVRSTARWDGPTKRYLCPAPHDPYTQTELVLKAGCLVEPEQALQINIIGEGHPGYVETMRDSVEKVRQLQGNGCPLRVLSLREALPAPDDFSQYDALIFTWAPPVLLRVASLALRSGTPIIAPREGVWEELITPDRNGILFEPGDYEDLARVLRQLAADPQGVARLHQSTALWADRELAPSRILDAILRQVEIAGAAPTAPTPAPTQPRRLILVAPVDDLSGGDLAAALEELGCQVEVTNDTNTLLRHAELPAIVLGALPHLPDVAASTRPLVVIVDDPDGLDVARLSAIRGRRPLTLVTTSLAAARELQQRGIGTSTPLTTIAPWIAAGEADDGAIVPNLPVDAWRFLAIGDPAHSGAAGTSVAIQAILRLAMSCPHPVRLDLLGKADPDLRKAIRAAQENLFGVSEATPWRWLDPDDPQTGTFDLATYHGVLILSSRLWRVPRALLRAWQAGLPTICLPRPATVEVIQPGVTSLLANEEPGSVLDALHALAEDPTLREKLSRAGREALLSRHTATDAARQILTILFGGRDN